MCGGRRQVSTCSARALEPSCKDRAPVGSRVALVAADATQTPAVITVDVDSEMISKIQGAEPITCRDSLSCPEPFS